MKKTQIANDLHLSVEGMKNLDARLTCPGGIFAGTHCQSFSLVLEDDTKWEFDKAEDFLKEYRPGLYTTYTRTCHQTGVELRLISYTDSSRFYTRAIFEARERATIDAISKILDPQLCIDFSTPQTKKRACRGGTNPRSTTETRSHGVTRRRILKGQRGRAI